MNGPTLAVSLEALALSADIYPGSGPSLRLGVYKQPAEDRESDVEECSLLLWGKTRDGEDAVIVRGDGPTLLDAADGLARKLQLAAERRRDELQRSIAKLAEVAR